MGYERFHVFHHMTPYGYAAKIQHFYTPCDPHFCPAPCVSNPQFTHSLSSSLRDVGVWERNVVPSLVLDVWVYSFVWFFLSTELYYYENLGESWFLKSFMIYVFVDLVEILFLILYGCQTVFGFYDSVQFHLLVLVFSYSFRTF